MRPIIIVAATLLASACTSIPSTWDRNPTPRVNTSSLSAAHKLELNLRLDRCKGQIAEQALGRAIACLESAENFAVSHAHRQKIGIALAQVYLMAGDRQGFVDTFARLRLDPETRNADEAYLVAIHQAYTGAHMPSTEPASHVGRAVRNAFRTE